LFIFTGSFSIRFLDFETAERIFFTRSAVSAIMVLVPVAVIGLADTRPSFRFLIFGQKKCALCGAKSSPSTYQENLGGISELAIVTVWLQKNERTILLYMGRLCENSKPSNYFSLI